MRASSIVLSALIALALLAPGAAAQGGPSQQISGMVGDPTVDRDAEAAPGAWLRYTGDPAPAGYSHLYQWAAPRVVTENPEEAPVTMSGTLDVADRETGSIAMLGFYDRQALASGAHGYQTGAFVYLYTRPDGLVVIGPSDGNTGGEIIQRFISNAELPDVLEITFIVDGTADPAGCADDPDDVATADGCLTLDLGDLGSLTESYGSILAPGSADPEFSTGAIPGWDSFTDDGSYGPSGISYDLVVSPVTMQDLDQCRRGGWQDFGFDNQGQCIRFVQTGQDSRT